MSFVTPVEGSGPTRTVNVSKSDSAINLELTAIKTAAVAAASDPEVAEAMVAQVETLFDGVVGQVETLTNGAVAQVDVLTAAAVAATGADRVQTGEDVSAAALLLAQTEGVRDATVLISASQKAFRQPLIFDAILQGLIGDDAVAVGATYTATGDDVDFIGLYRRTGDAATEVAQLPKAALVTDLQERLPGPFRVSALPIESGFVWGVVDSNDRIALGVTPEGRIYLNPVDGTPGTIPLEITNSTLLGDSGWLWALLDSNGRIGCGLRPEGTFWARLAEDAPMPASWQSQQLTNLLPSPDIVCWGDSMTAGAGGGGTTYPGVLAAALGRAVDNRGIGGQDDKAIATRQGGRPMLVSVTGDQIPASGPVTLTARSQTPITNQGASSFTGTLAGVRGTLYASTADVGATYTYWFTREASGSVVACPPNSQFVFDFAVAGRAKTVGLWCGRNGNRSTRAGRLEIRDSVLAMAEYLSPQIKRFFVLPIFNGRAVSLDGGAYEPSGSVPYVQIMLANEELARTFGPLFLGGARDYMVNHAIYDAGLTPTADDLSDMAADCVPRQMMADNVHGTAVFYTQLGLYVARHFKAMGW